MRTILKLLIAGGAVGVLAGCGDDDDHPSTPAREPAASVRVVGSEYAYSMPREIPGEIVSMEFVNTGDEVHEYAMGRVDPPHTVDEFVKLILDPADEGEQEEPDWAHDIGGVPALSPGERVTITRRLKPGTYGLLCFVPAPDGKTHLEHGMHTQFTVTADRGGSLPTADAVIEAREEDFAVPVLHAGRRTIELRNTARDEREFGLIRLDPDKSLEDAERYFDSGAKGDPPLALLGAMQSIPPETSVFLTLDLHAGRTYVVSDEENELRSEFKVRR
jgi:uncharacterized cupredoxin-like copper-binding protein